MTYEIIWLPKAEKDLEHWHKHNKRMLYRILELIDSIEKHPMQGIGKPERLKYKDQNIWSRRIDHAHRLVYHVGEDQTVHILQCRMHYDAH